MTLALLIAGIFAVVAGLLSILFGIAIKEFSLGNTLILSGTVGVCSGMLLVGLHAVVLELKGLGRRLANTAAPEVRVRPVLPPGIAPAPVLAPDAAAGEITVESPAPLPWQDEAVVRERQRTETPPVPEAPTPAPEGPRRRNLLFQSTSRKERERAQSKATEDQPPENAEAPPASFDVAWPKPERMRPPEPLMPRRPVPQRGAPPFAEPPAAPPEAASEPPAEQPAVTVLKSGVVDGMAYSLYSDGSIEAQMPEGLMRFASIDELRAHLDQRS